MGRIPVVDLKHNNSQYFKDNRVYQDNIWEYFFKQVREFNTENIPENSDVIFAKNDANEYFDILEETIFENLNGKDEVDPKFFDIIQFSDEMQSYFDDEFQTLKNEEILGILCRGTDYTRMRPFGHYVQPFTDDVIKKAEELLRKYPITKIWLATEDIEIYKKFEDKFGDILIKNKQYRYGKVADDVFLANVDVERENHRYNLAKEYMLSVYILTRCKYLISGHTSAVIGLWYFSRGFRNQKVVSIWYIGRYQKKSKLNYEHFFERIFSVKDATYENKNYEIITIFGFKIKLFKNFRNKTVGFER